MKADIWMPLYIGDYLADTARLTTEQHGAYLLLIMDYWRSGKLPDDDRVLSQICKMPLDAWSNARASIQHYFSIEDGFWVHARIEAEKVSAVENQGKKTNQARKAAEARWAKEKNNAQSNASSNAGAMLEQCPSPSPSYNKKTTTLSGIPDRGSAVQILEHLNTKAGRKYRPVDANVKIIIARLKEFSYEDCIRVINDRVDKWGADPKMYEYLTPATLFAAANFAKYQGNLDATLLESPKVLDWRTM